MLSKQVKQLLQEQRVQEAADLLAEALQDSREGKAAVPRLSPSIS